MSSLRETLKKLNEDTLVAIGAKDGHSFMYFGPAGDTETIEKLFDKYYKRVKTQRQTALGALSKLLSEPLEKEDGDAEYLDKLLRKADEVAKRRNSYVAATKYVGEYKPVMDREVVDRYRKEVDNCRAILVEGMEQGEFWTKEEFDQKFKK